MTDSPRPDPTGQASCPICGGTLTRAPGSRNVVVARCSACEHRVARFARADEGAADYHSQYDQTAFLASLGATRRRQARRIVEELGQQMSHADHLLDYGSGRGWLVDAAREAGMRFVAAADTSHLAVEAAASRGIEAHLLRFTETGERRLPIPRLSFAPRLLTLLDVIEHLPPPDLVCLLGGLVRALSASLELVVVKVPVSAGILFRTAEALARLGIHGPLEQLFQVGTAPPHLSYFSRRSLEILLERIGVDPLHEFTDADFEPELLPQRVQALRGLPAFANAVAKAGARLLAAAPSRHDSCVVIARVTRTKRSWAACREGGAATLRARSRRPLA